MSTIDLANFIYEGRESLRDEQQRNMNSRVRRALLLRVPEVRELSFTLASLRGERMADAADEKVLDTLIALARRDGMTPAAFIDRYCETMKRKIAAIEGHKK